MWHLVFKLLCKLLKYFLLKTLSFQDIYQFIVTQAPVAIRIILK
jgi:hypothetical protein